jgi:hypothetical protein
MCIPHHPTKGPPSPPRSMPDMSHKMRPSPLSELDSGGGGSSGVGPDNWRLTSQRGVATSSPISKKLPITAPPSSRTAPPRVEHARRRPSAALRSARPSPPPVRARGARGRAGAAPRPADRSRPPAPPPGGGPRDAAALEHAAATTAAWLAGPWRRARRRGCSPTCAPPPRAPTQPRASSSRARRRRPRARPRPRPPPRLRLPRPRRPAPRTTRSPPPPRSATRSRRRGRAPRRAARLHAALAHPAGSGACRRRRARARGHPRLGRVRAGLRARDRDAAGLCHGRGRPRRRVADEDERECSVCIDGRATAVTYPCGHQTICSRCAQDCVTQNIRECTFCCTELTGFWLNDKSTNLVFPPK